MKTTLALSLLASMVRHIGVGGMSLALCCLLIGLPVGSALAAPPMLQVDGKPFFPIGWYDSRLYGSAADATAAFSGYPSQGMNSILLCYNNWGNPLAMTPTTLDGAAANGLEVMVEINRYAVQGLEGYPLSLIDDQVNAIKSHPALLGYYLMDEPELQGVSAATLQARYAQIKALDATHPISVVQTSGGQVVNYLSAEPPPYTDILMTDTYTVYAGIPEFSGAMFRSTILAKFAAQLAETYGKPAYFNVPQAHSADGTFGLRSPTFAEQRYLSYAPIVVGARGLFYWMHYYTTEDYRTNVVGPIAREIQSLVPAIVSNSTAVSVSSNRDSDTTGNGIEDVSYLLGEDDNGGYRLIAVNNTPYACSVTFSLSGDSLASFFGSDDVNIPVLFEGRDVLLQRGAGSTWTITDNFGPYDVNVYSIPEPGTLVLLATGLLGVLVYAWRKRR